uniref:Uncharacterized protein n=1 Tax=Odontella aurita TaxID=265563 RepID=A0A7S4IPU7_9STRA
MPSAATALTISPSPFPQGQNSTPPLGAPSTEALPRTHQHQRGGFAALPPPPTLAVLGWQCSKSNTSFTAHAAPCQPPLVKPGRTSFDHQRQHPQATHPITEQQHQHLLPAETPVTQLAQAVPKAMAMTRQTCPTITTPASPHSAATGFLLALPEDPQVLNPVHCFVRRNVEVFAATPEDIAAPAPGRKNRVAVGQVGIRCIHCCDLPPRDRVKRAVCFPPSVSGIYHSVSNMKFDHFGVCRGLSPRARDDFARLKARCGRKGASASSDGNSSSSKGRGGGGGKSSTSTANSTAQYYYESSARLGLIDTEQGIRLAPPPAATASSSFSTLGPPPPPLLPPPAQVRQPQQQTPPSPPLDPLRHQTHHPMMAVKMPALTAPTTTMHPHHIISLTTVRTPSPPQVWAHRNPQEHHQQQHQVSPPPPPLRLHGAPEVAFVNHSATARPFSGSAKEDASSVSALANQHADQDPLTGLSALVFAAATRAV